MRVVPSMRALTSAREVHEKVVLCLDTWLSYLVMDSGGWNIRSALIKVGVSARENHTMLRHITVLPRFEGVEQACAASAGECPNRYL